MKRFIGILLSFVLTLGCISILPASAAEDSSVAPSGFEVKSALYAHAVTGSSDGEAWQEWQSVHDEIGNPLGGTAKYFFLPCSADENEADVYNGYSSSVTVNGTSVPAGETRTVSYEAGRSYSVYADGRSYSLTFMRSSAEAAVYINNPDADGNGSELLGYLSADKGNSASATGAIVSPDGEIDNTAIKKIKGRGNTSWDKPKKGFNVTYDKKVSVGGMGKNKKYSLIANYQDDSISRNRILYDLSDAVGMPYASDSRYIDFYVNGYYVGAYLMAEKVEEGSLVTDVSGKEYLADDGSVNPEFSFIAEVDASAGGDDYYFTCDNGVKITVKAPELEPEDPGYNEVREYIRGRCNALMSAVKSTSQLPDIVDADSCAKLWLINELGKNWDSGVSSTFFTYKPDENGNYKFYGSPVWDYDNSLGNAVGVGSDLNSFGVTDYTEYTGWWCRFKDRGRYASSSENIINNLSRNSEIQAAAARIWFEEFVPAINHFSGKTGNRVTARDLLFSYDYYTRCADSAAMNYRSGWPTNGAYGWVAEHTSLKKASFDFYTGTYSVQSSTTRYAQDFEGFFRYAKDWMISRAAWLSNQMYSSYTGSKVKYDVDRSGGFGVADVTLTQRILAEYGEFGQLTFELADINLDGRVNIRDVTMMQRALSDYDISSGISKRPDPWNENPDEPEGDVVVRFTDALSWGNIHIYYYGSGNYPLTWPGEAMAFSNGVYTARVPDYVEYIIFADGTGSVQTEKIPFDGQSHSYRALSQTYANGRHYYQIT